MAPTVGPLPPSTCQDDYLRRLCLDKITFMTIEDLEKAVSKLPPDQLAKFREWFEAFDTARFDDKIERHIAAGKLDNLAEQALADFRQGRTRKL